MRVIRGWLRSLARITMIWLPLTGAFVLVGMLIEVGYAQRSFAAHYSAPVHSGQMVAASEYAAHATPDGWQFFGTDDTGKVVLDSFSSRGRLIRRLAVDPNGLSAGDASMVWTKRDELGVWVAGDGSQNLRLALIGRRVRTSTDRSSGAVGHPVALVDPRGGFDVVYSAQMTSSGNTNIYFLRISAAGRPETSPKLLVSSPAFGFYPAAAWDGSGHLDILYMELCCGSSEFEFEFRRFTVRMRPVGNVRILDKMSTSEDGDFPPRWGLDMQRSSGGGVLAAWEGSAGIFLARWDATGRLLFRRVVVTSSVAFGPRSLSLAALPSGGGVLYYTQPGPFGNIIESTAFSSEGGPGATERVSYDQNGSAANAEASVTGETPRISWDNVHASGETGTLETSTYQPVPRVSFLNRMGLGVGNPAVDLIFLAAGSLLAGLMLTIVNALLVVPLLLVWFPIARFVPERFSWRTYAGLVSLVLIPLFAVPTFASHWMFLMSPLSAPFGWFAVAGAIFTGLWVGSVGLKDQEPTVKALGVTASAFFFLAAMWALAGIQSHLSVT